MHERLAIPFRLAAGAAALAFCAAAGATQIQVTIENLAPANSVSVTPLQLGFGNGSFDPFDNGATASTAVTRVAELGDGTQWRAAFAAAESNASVGAIAHPAVGILVPGEIASSVFTVDTVSNPFFTFAAMVLPSNDSFIGNDLPMQYRVFDAAGRLAITSIVQTANDIWDAGSEAFEIASAAFVGNALLHTDEGGTVSRNFAQLAGFDGQTTGAGYVFASQLAGETPIYRISFAVPEPAGLALMLPGLLAVGWVGRRRSNRQGAASSLSAV